MVIVEYWTGDNKSTEDRITYDEYPGVEDWFFETGGILNISIANAIASYEPGSWIKVHREDE